MATERDDVVTTFRVLGERETTGAYRSAGTAANFYQQQIDTARRGQVVYGAVLAASTAVLAAYGNAVLAAADDQATFQRTAGNFRGAFPKEEVEAFTGSLQTLTGIDDDKIAATVGVLGTFQISPSLARDLTLPILNASEALKALGLTSESVAAQVGKAVQTGNAGALRRAGIVIDADQFRAAGTEAERVRLIIAALDAQGGQAAIQFRDSLPGALQAFRTELNSANEGIGEGGIGLARLATEGGVKALQAFNALPGPIKAVGGLLVGTLAAAMAVYSAGTLVALNNTIRLGEAYLQTAAKAGTLATATNGLAAVQGRVAATSAGGTAAARFGAFAGSGAGRAAGVAGVAGLALGFLPDTGNAGLDLLKATGAGALGGAATGAALGSLFPGAGTAIGAVIGGVGGALAGGFGKEEELRQRGGGSSESETVALLREQLRVAQQQLEHQRQISDNSRPRPGTLAFSELPGREQFGSIFD